MDAGGARIDNANFKAYGETLVGGSAGTNTGSAYSVDLSTGNEFNLILNAIDFTFSNPLRSGSGRSCAWTRHQSSSLPRPALPCKSPQVAVRPEGAKHLWRRIPPG
jgi:hypothetical protein